jgi:hypothetical protein
MSGHTNPEHSDTDVVKLNDGQKPTAKKIKREEDGEVETIPPVSSRGWHDIPDWGDREDSPLMDLPSELLDKIFCVRPELGVSLLSGKSMGYALIIKCRDYVALAGACKFFRHHMTDNFWKVCLARTQ